MHDPADFEAKTRLTAAEKLALEYSAKLETRSASNLQRHLIIQHLRSVLTQLPEDIRSALVQGWDA